MANKFTLIFLYVATALIPTALSNPHDAFPHQEEALTIRKHVNYNQFKHLLALKLGKSQLGEEGKILLQIGDKCGFDPMDPLANLKSCDLLNTYQLCQEDGTCGCASVGQLVKDLTASMDSETKEIISHLISEFQSLGIQFGTAHDPQTNQCLLSEGSFCLRQEINFQQIFPNVSDIELINKSLNNLKCGGNFKCEKANDFPWFPKEIGKCLKTDVSPGGCDFNNGFNSVPSYLQQCNAHDSHQVCYNDNSCGCFDIGKVLLQLSPVIDSEIYAIIKTSLAKFASLDYTFRTTPDEKGGKCLLTENSVCARAPINLQALMNFPGVDEVEDIMTKLECGVGLKCLAIDQEHDIPEEIGVCGVGAASAVISSGLSMIFLMLGSYLLVDFKF